ncbi:hypothetical protein F0562_013393 [Nyssa sinensis]|uniref:Uncharacterized protein n=1 Tax=Nyssa sinensis TaxID=561372 RepID=A0A5J4ZK39_9ASTE|nr:hypothetical protein F0562_013393 [Nyssa sinensis]
MASKQPLFVVFNDPHGAKNVSHSMQDSELVSKVLHQTVTTSATHGGFLIVKLKDATAVSNFEDGEVYASTPVAAMPDSPARLTWADQASSGEFIPKEALDLEEEYRWFLS